MTGWGLPGGEAGQWWSLQLPEASEVTGDRMPSHLLVAAAAYTGTLSPESGSRTWQRTGACAARPAARALHSMEMWAETPWGEKKHFILQALLVEALSST